MQRISAVAAAWSLLLGPPVPATSWLLLTRPVLRLQASAPSYFHSQLSDLEAKRKKTLKEQVGGAGWRGAGCYGLGGCT